MNSLVIMGKLSLNVYYKMFLIDENAMCTCWLPFLTTNISTVIAWNYNPILHFVWPEVGGVNEFAYTFVILQIYNTVLSIVAT